MNVKVTRVNISSLRFDVFVHTKTVQKKQSYKFKIFNLLTRKNEENTNSVYSPSQIQRVKIKTANIKKKNDQQQWI